MLAILEGFAGYSLLDDLLSGMGLAIALLGRAVDPADRRRRSRYAGVGRRVPGRRRVLAPVIVHVLIVPALIGALIAMHLAIVVRQHRSSAGRGRTERNVVGTPLWPAYALRSVGLLLAVAARAVLLGGLVQINPIWQWGPYEPCLATNGAQPDWYLGWLIGALRLMPAWSPRSAATR